MALGYQGFGNVGDEAILAGIERLLEGVPIQVTAIIAGDRAPIPAFPAARRILTRRLLPGLRGVRAIRGADVLLISGGGLIHDHWRIVLPRYLAWSLLARALGTRVAWIGVGVGPLRARWARWLAGRSARLATLVTVRDEDSAALLRDVARGVRVEVVPDPAVYLEPVRGAHDAGTAIIVRRPVPSEAYLAPRLESAIAEFAAARLRRGVPVTFLAMERDTDVAAVIADRVARTGTARPGVEELAIDPADAVRRLGGFADMAGMRLHAVLLAALAGTPCLPIGYDPKVVALASRLGLEDLTVPLDEVNASALEAGMIAVAASGCQARVAQALSSLRAERARVAGLLTDFARG